MRISSLLTGMLAFAVAAAPAWADPQLTLSAGYDRSTGNYRGIHPLVIQSVPLSAKLKAGRWVAKLTVPYISIEGHGRYTPNGTHFWSYDPQVVRASGLGDVVASLGYMAYYNPQRTFFLDVSGKVKFGTADASKELGSGKNDYTLQLDGAWLTGPLTWFSTLGYRVLGSPTGIKYNPVWLVSLGGAWKTSDNTSVGLVADWRTKSHAGGTRHRINTLFFNHKINSQWKWQAYIYQGQSRADPDMGGGLSASRTF